MRTVSAPLAASAYPESFWRKPDARCYTHAVEVNEKNEPVRIMCRKAKVTSVLPDSSLYDTEPVDCPACVAALAKIEARKAPRPRISKL